MGKAHAWKMWARSTTASPREQMQRLILVQEALQEKRLADIAAKIAERGNVKFVMIAGPSSSGKTTFAHRLSVQLEAIGLKPHPISVDNYFVDRVNSPRDEQGNYNYEALECLDLEQFNGDMLKLLAGEQWNCPITISRRACGSTRAISCAWGPRTFW